LDLRCYRRLTGSTLDYYHLNAVVLHLSARFWWIYIFYNHWLHWCE